MNGIRFVSNFAAAFWMLAFFPAIGHAQCSPSMVTTLESPVTTSTATTSYENVGLYEWDQAQLAWVLLGASYHPFYETEVKQSYDTFVPSSVLWAPVRDGGGGGGVVDPQRTGKRGKPGREVQILCDAATTLPRVTATGTRPLDLGGSMLSVIWRGALLNGTYGSGGGQRSTSAALPAPSTAEAVTCDSEMEVKSRNAQHTAAHYGMKPGPRHRNRTITIKWSTGTTEKYVNTGKIATIWMVPVPDTCEAGGE